MRLAALLSIAGTGCSFLAVSDHPTEPLAPWREAPLACNSYAAPAIDGLVAAAGLGFAGALASAGDGHDDGVAVLAFGIPSLVIGVVAAASAIHGVRSVKQCNTENPTPPPPPPLAPIEVPHEFFCSIASAGDNGVCTGTIEGCERVRAIHVAAQREMTACQPQANAACFTYRTSGDLGHYACAPSARICDALRAKLEYRLGISALDACR